MHALISIKLPSLKLFITLAEINDTAVVTYGTRSRDAITKGDVTSRVNQNNSGIIDDALTVTYLDEDCVHGYKKAFTVVRETN